MARSCPRHSGIRSSTAFALERERIGNRLDPIAPTRLKCPAESPPFQSKPDAPFKRIEALVEPIVACLLDKPEIVRLLLEHGANPNTSPESSGSAVMHARRNPEVLALLLRYGAKDESRPFEEIDRLIEERRLEDLEKRLRETGLMGRQGKASWGEGILAGPANAGDIELARESGAASTGAWDECEPPVVAGGDAFARYGA